MEAVKFEYISCTIHVYMYANKCTYALIDCIQKICSVLMCSDVTNESITDNAHAYVYI